MATELGVAYLSLAASTGQFSRDVKGAFGDFEATAGKSSKRSGSLIGGALKSGIGLGVKAVSALGVAVVGLAATGGINRAIAIEGAQKKLEGLGHSAKSITTIMGNALASVRGTAYGLGDAASVAAMMSASGVKEGKALEATLKSIADVAAISGRSLTDIGLIYGSIAARGKLQGDDMRQLMASGIPVTQLLGKELHKTTGEVSAMVTQGEIDFKTFQKAMQEGMGGAALKSGETFKGALANVYAALGRLGAVVATPALAGLKTLFNAAIPAIDAVTSKLGPLMDSLGPKFSAAITSGLGLLPKVSGAMKSAIGPAVDSIRGVLSGLLSGIDIGALVKSGTQIASAFSPLGLVFKALQPILPQIASAFASLAQQGLGALVPLASSLGPLFARVSTALVTAGTQIGAAIIPVVLQLAQSAMPVLMQVINALVPVISQIASAFLPVASVVAQLATSLLPPLSTAILSLLPAVEPLVSAVLGIVQALLPVVGIVVSLVQQLLPPLMSVISALLPPIVKLVSTLASALAPIIAAIGRVITALMPILSLLVTIIGAVVSAVAPLVAILLGGLVNVLSVVISWLGVAVTAVVDFLAGLIGGLTSLPQIMGGASNAIGGFFSGLWSGIASAAQSVWNGIVAFFRIVMKNLLFVIIGPLGTLVLWVVANWDRIVALTQSIWNQMVAFLKSIPARIVAGLALLASLPGRVAAWFGGVVTSARAKFNAVVAFIGSVPGRVTEGLSALSRIPSQVGAWFAGLLSAVSAKFSQVVTYVKSIPGKIKSALGGIGSLLVSSGRALVSGFLNGIKGAWDGLVSWVKNGMATLRGLWPFSPAKWGPFSGHGYVTYSGKALGEDFAASLAAQKGRVQSAASGLMASAQLSGSALSGSVSAVGAASAGGDAKSVALALADVLEARGASWLMVSDRITAVQQLAGAMA